MNEIAVNRINELHKGIEEKLRSSVSDAIEIGRLLTEQKERLQHGEFLPWLKGNCNFSDRTARRYMSLFDYSDKLASVSDLQEAYRHIETIERQENQSETQKARRRVDEYIKTSVKPEGWRRGTDDKLYQEELERRERIEKAKERMIQAEERRQEQREHQDSFFENLREESDFLNHAADVVLETSKKRREFKDRIKLSQSGERDPFIDALMDYLEEMEDDNRRIEACQNIIKVCRNISVELQRKS